jgi:hypothetical protein
MPFIKAGPMDQLPKAKEWISRLVGSPSYIARNICKSGIESGDVIQTFEGIHGADVRPEEKAAEMLD